MVPAVVMAMVLALQAPGEIVTYCDPAIVIPPPDVSANFTGEVVRVDQERSEAGVVRQTAEVAHRFSVSGPAPQQNVSVTLDIDPNAACAQFQPQLRVGSQVRIYMGADDTVAAWTVVSPVDRAQE